MSHPRAAAVVGSSALALVLATISVARADEVMPPPQQCPAGCEGVTSHAGPACVRPACNSDADCDHGTRCDLRCISWTTYGAAGELGGGPRPKPEPPSQDTPLAVHQGPCGHGETCPAGSQCAPAARCAEVPGHACSGLDATPGNTSSPPAAPHAASAPTATTAASGGGCCAHESAASRSASMFLALGGIGLAVVLARRGRL